jgi:hypothetical protein
MRPCLYNNSLLFWNCGGVSPEGFASTAAMSFNWIEGGLLDSEWGLFTPLPLTSTFSFNQLLSPRSRESLGLQSSRLDTCSQSVLIRRNSKRLRAYSLHIKYAATAAPWSGSSKAKYSRKSGVFSHPQYFSPPPSLTLMSFFRCAPESCLDYSLVV